jgi:hypothetical protein
VFEAVLNNYDFEQKKIMSWMKVPGSPGTLEAEVAAMVGAALEKGSIKQADLDYLSRYRLAALQESLVLSSRELELLRNLCAIWGREPLRAPITSHRRVIGPLLVAAKKALFPLIRGALGPELQRQQEFNGALIEFLIARGTAASS